MEYGDSGYQQSRSRLDLERNIDNEYEGDSGVLPGEHAILMCKVWDCTYVVCSPDDYQYHLNFKLSICLPELNTCRCW